MEFPREGAAVTAVLVMRLVAAFCGGILGGYLCARISARSQAMTALLEEERARQKKDQALHEAFMAALAVSQDTVARAERAHKPIVQERNAALYKLGEIQWRLRRQDERYKGTWPPPEAETRMASMQATLEEIAELVVADTSPKGEEEAAPVGAIDRVTPPR